MTNTRDHQALPQYMSARCAGHGMHLNPAGPRIITAALHHSATAVALTCAFSRMCMKAGTRKPHVLPLPVEAMATRSRPCTVSEVEPRVRNHCV